METNIQIHVQTSKPIFKSSLHFFYILRKIIFIFYYHIFYVMSRTAKLEQRFFFFIWFKIYIKIFFYSSQNRYNQIVIGTVIIYISTFIFIEIILNLIVIFYKNENWVKPTQDNDTTFNSKS